MIRRFFDIFFAMIWLILTAPIIALIAFIIGIDSPGPIFYTPEMIGLNGRSFRLFRFRTMYMDKTTLIGDGRFTRFGHYIRNYSLDHLPMLFNLLKGDLTVIGPRPMEMNNVELRDPYWQQYFQVKPGLFNFAVFKMGRTWTSSHASRPDINLKLELEYIEKQSPGFDLRLFLRSIRAYLSSHGNIKARGKPDPDIEDRFSRHQD